MPLAVPLAGSPLAGRSAASCLGAGADPGVGRFEGLIPYPPKRNRRYVYCSLTSLASIMPAAIGAPPPYGKSTPLLWTVHRR